jgi:hypothetical protein
MPRSKKRTEQNERCHSRSRVSVTPRSFQSVLSPDADVAFCVGVRLRDIRLSNNQIISLHPIYLEAQRMMERKPYQNLRK